MEPWLGLGRRLEQRLVEPILEQRRVGTELVEPDMVSMVEPELYTGLGNLVTSCPRT